MGYNSTTLVKGKYNLISLPFSSVTGGNSRLVDAMSGSGWCFKTDSTDSDTLEVWNPVTTAYTMYYWWEDETHLYDGWYDAGGSYFFDECEENQDGIECGWTAWYHSRGDSAPNVTFSGAVEPADDVQITVYGGCYNLIANPFPTAFQPNADQPWWSESHTEAKLVDWNGPVAVTDSTDSDTIEFWDPATANYVMYYYWEDSSHEYDGWYDAGGSYFFEEDPAHPENVNGIPAGKVFWYRSRATKGTSKKITFINPTK